MLTKYPVLSVSTIFLLVLEKYRIALEMIINFNCKTSCFRTKAIKKGNINCLELFCYYYAVPILCEPNSSNKITTFYNNREVLSDFL